MSIQTLNRFEWIKAVLQEEGLGAAAKNVASALAIQFANDETGQLNPTQETLADYLKVHRDTVKRAIRELRNAGWLMSLGDGGRGKAPMLRFLSPSKIIPFRASKTGQISPGNADKRGAETPPQAKKRGADLQQKGGKNTTPLYKDKQSYEQKSGIPDRFADHLFLGNFRPGVIYLDQKAHWPQLNEWADWLDKNGFPKLCDMPVSGKSEKSTVFFLPYRKPPSEEARCDEARRFFTTLLDEEGASHAAQ